MVSTERNWQSRLLDVLQTSSVFSLLDGVVLHELAESMECRSVAGGSVVLTQDEAADSMIIVVSGRLRVWRREADGTPMLYNEIGPGDSVGETAVILRQARTANVTALRDSSLAVLSRTAFEALLIRHPVALNRVFSQAVYNYLRHTTQLTDQRKAQSLVVVPLEPGAGADIVASDLANAFSRMGRADHLNFGSLRGQELHAASLEKRISHLDELESRFDFLVYEAEPTASLWTRSAVRQADQVIFVAGSDSRPGPTDIERLLAEEPGFSMKRKHLVLLHPASATRPGDVNGWRNGRDVERLYPLREGNASDFSRLARFLTGTAVGVVLGGGGARGFAHIGALKALEEARIPIDLLGGNSMGALIGAQYACDVPLDEILERTRSFALGGEMPTVPVVSLLSGRRLERDLKRMFGNTTIEGLWRPYFAAACNLSQACTTIQDNGYLWRAVLASNSPAGLLPPVVHQGDLLVDGAIFENVPVNAMRSRLGTPLERRHGNGIIIAIDVDVRDELGADPGLDRLSLWGALRGRFVAGSPVQPGIADILYRAGHISGLHQRAHTVASADFYLEPPVANFPLMAYRRAAEISKVGYCHTVKELERWNLPQIYPR
jgi:NTE family protein/lysophospholipid hydrolase